MTQICNIKRREGNKFSRVYKIKVTLFSFFLYCFNNAQHTFALFLSMLLNIKIITVLRCHWNIHLLSPQWKWWNCMIYVIVRHALLQWSFNKLSSQELFQWNDSLVIVNNADMFIMLKVKTQQHFKTVWRCWSINGWIFTKPSLIKILDVFTGTQHSCIQQQFHVSTLYSK